MNRLIDFSDGENTYRVPESEVETFKASVPNARQMSQFVGKDGSRYSVPEDEIEAFKASVPDAEAVNRFQLSNGERYTVQQSRMSKFLRSRQYREGDADAIAAKRAEIDAATPKSLEQSVPGAIAKVGVDTAEAALKGGVRTVGKYGRAFTGMVTDPLRLAGMIFGGRDNALVKGADWINDKWDWFSEDLGVGLSSGSKTQDVLSSIGEIGTSGLASIMPWLVGGGAASKGARMALKGVNSLAAGGSSSTDMYDELKANGADEATAFRGALTAGAVSTAFAYTFGTLSAENFLKGAGAKEASKLIAGEVVAKKKGFNEIVRSVANGRMRGDIMNFLAGAAEEGVTEGAESFVLNVLKQHGSGEDVDLEEALLKALPDAAAGAALGGVMTGARAIEWAKNGGPRKFYEKQARAEVSQLMNDMAPGDIREMNPKAFDAAAKKRRLGGTVSRKDGEEIGLPPNWTQEQRNEVLDEWNHEQTARKEKRAKMDGQQEMALREEIQGFVGEGPEAQRVYDRVTMKLKDASVLDDPYQRENLVMQAAEAVWNEDQAQRVGGARQKARMAEKADHEARVAEAEAQAAEAAQRAENDAQERTNAEMTAREEKRYDDFMLAREEARAKGGQNETRTNEAQQKPDEAQPVTSPAGEAAVSVPQGAQGAEADGAVEPPAAVQSPKAEQGNPVGVDAPQGEKSSSGGTEADYQSWLKRFNLPDTKIRRENWFNQFSKDEPVRRDALDYVRTMERWNGEDYVADVADQSREGAKSQMKPSQIKTKLSSNTPTSAPTETQANTPPTTAERAERNFDASDAVSTPTKPKTVREGKAFVNSNIGKQFTDGKKTYEITGLTKDGEVSVKATDKDGKSSETTLKLSGTLTNIFGTKKKSAVWSEVKTPETEQNSQNRTKTTAETPKTEQNVPKTEIATWKDRAGNEHQIEGYVKSDGSKINIGEEIVVSHSNGIPYKGKIVSIGTKNVVIKTQGGMGGEAELKFPRSEIVGKRDTSTGVTDGKSASVEESASEKRQTHAETVEELVKSAGKDIGNLGEVRPPKPKIGAKPGYVTPAKKLDAKSVVSALKNVASKDSGYPSLNRVHVENGEMVATDGRIIVYAKAPKGVSDGEYGTSKVGETKRDEAYTASWKSVPNFIAKGGYSEVGTIANGDTSADAIHFSATLHKATTKATKTRHNVTLRIGDAVLNGEHTKSVVDAMFRLGCKDIKVLIKDAVSPVVFKGKNADGEVTGVQMPLRLDEHFSAEKSTHVRIFGKNVTSSKMEPKSAPKSEPKAETKVEVKEESETKSKSEVKELQSSLDAYLSDKKPMEAARARKTLEKKVDRGNGKVSSDAELLESLVGRKDVKIDPVSSHEYKGVKYYSLWIGDSTTAESINKTGVEYARHLGIPIREEGSATSESAPTITPAEAMKKLGSLGAMDVDTLTKALAREERAGHTERANMIRVLRDYKRGVGTNPNPQSDESLGGKYRASVEAAKPLDDPAFVAWAKKRGVAPTTQKRNEYDKAMSDTLKDRLSRWIKGVSVNTVNFIAPEEGGDVKPIHDGERIVGSYNRATGEVKLAKGASVETVLHELGWHAARHWAEVNADSDTKSANLLNQMKEYAESAPKEIKDAVRDVYGDLDADTLLDEIGAARFTKEQSGKIAKAIATKEGAAWYQKVWNKVVDFYKNFLTKIGYNRVDLDGVENMSPEVFGDFLADVMMSGKQLGERTAFSMDAPKSLAAKWTENLSDYKAPIAELEKRTTGSSNNIYYLARTLEGQAQRGKNRAERSIKRVEKILGEDISPELLAQYMQLKAYEERNAKIERRNGKADASGMTPEDARAIEKTINESGVDEAIFEEAAQILWDLQKEGLQARVDAGLLDQETANKWMTDEPHHIPWKDAVDPDSGEYVGRKVGASEFDTAEGRKTAASGDPITWMLQEYQDAMTRAAQNRLRSSIANLTRLNGDVGIIYDGIQTDSKGKRSFIKYPKDGGKAKVLSIPEGVKIESTVKNDGGMKNVLTFKEGGETKYLVLNGTLGEAVAGAVTGRTLSRPPAWISWVMRGYAATATSLSPAFAARNITADNFDIHNNLVAKYGWVKGEKMFGKVVKEQFLMTKQLGSYIKNGDFKFDKDGKITDFQKLVEAYEDAGGLIGGMATEGYDATVKKIQADFRAGRNKARSIGKSVATYWTMMQKMSELAPRLAVFKSAMESGMSAKDAAMLSREITVDFNKKGAKTPWFNTLWMFSNSALGANLTQMKGLAGKAGAKLAGGLVMYGFAEGMLEALMNGDDDEREKEGLASGKDINEYTRQNSLYIRKGDKVFRVNIHMGPFAYAKYFGNVMARTFSGMIPPEKAAKELGLTAAEVAASFTGLGNVSGDALVQTSVPTIIQPFVQIATNKDYAGRIVKKEKYPHEKHRPYSSLGRKSTPSAYHWMAKRINEFFGGSDYRKGSFLGIADMDVAPETVKILTEMVGKNFVKDIMEISETGYKLLSGNAKDLDVRNVPFAGDVVRKQEGNDNRFYESLNRYGADKEELKDPLLKGDERRAYLKEHPWLYSAGKPGVTRIDNIVKRIEKLRDVEESDRATEARKAEAKATRRKLQARVIEIMTKK